MDKILIISPDKISLNMMFNFLYKMLGRDYKVVRTHVFMEKEGMNQAIDEYCKKNEKIIFVHYAKKMINKDLSIAIPEFYLKKCDMILWLDLYSTEVKIVKDEFDNFSRLYMEKWKKHIELLNQGG